MIQYCRNVVANDSKIKSQRIPPTPPLKLNKLFQILLMIEHQELNFKLNVENCLRDIKKAADYI